MTDEQLSIMRHSCAHLVALAAKELYPEAKFGVGPVIDNGFYYDIEFPQTISEDDLKKIEKKALELKAQNLDFIKKTLPIDEAISFFKKNNQPYKVELLQDLKTKGTTKINEKVQTKIETVSLYQVGSFIDLCRGPHVKNTNELGVFKLYKLSGAYWRGDQNREQLQRIYGLCFTTKKELDDYLEFLKEAERRDHRVLGKELDLFSFHTEGVGFPFFKPKGMVVWNELLRYWHEEHNKAKYGEVKTPIMLSRKLWEVSGHWENYRENMYELKIDNQEYAVKPMNCPGGMLIYKESLHSYRDLPLRWAEIGLVHRHELSGVLSGLFRVRSFHQDDAHIFMTPDQIKDEILGVLNLIDNIYSKFGLKYHLELSTRPEKSIGTDEAWELATNGLKQALDSTGKNYKINEGDGAFYGPKIDVHVEDAIGRTWQCGTIQLDMNLPERFNLVYVDKDGQEKRPIMIHRVIYGSIERFLGILIEHYAGEFPVWLSPVQIKLVSVSDKHNEEVKKIAQEIFNKYNLRVDVDLNDETVGNKVRKAVKEKIPYIIVVGDREIQADDWTIRIRNQKEQIKLNKNEFLEKVVDKYKNREFNLGL